MILWQKQVAATVCGCDLPQRAAGNTSGERSWRDIVGDNATSTDDGVCTNVDAAENCYIRCQPDIIIDMNFLSIFGECCSLSVRTDPQTLAGEQRVICCQQGDIGADGYIIANADTGIVHDQQVKVGHEMVANKGVLAVVELHGPLEAKGSADAAENVFEQGRP